MKFVENKFKLMSSGGPTSKIFESLIKTFRERSISLLNNFKNQKCYMLAKKAVGNTLLSNKGGNRPKILATQSYFSKPIFYDHRMLHSPHENVSTVCDFPHKIIEKCFQ